MTDENKKIHEPETPPDTAFGHKESGQIEPIKSVEAPLPSRRLVRTTTELSRRSCRRRSLVC